MKSKATRLALLIVLLATIGSAVQDTAQSLAAASDPSDNWQQWMARAYQLEKQGHYTDATFSFRNAMAVSERLQQPGRLAKSQAELATLLFMRGEYIEAESLFIRAIATLEGLPGQPHLASVLANFARYYSLQGQFDKAEALCRRALDLQSRSQPRDELGIAASSNVLAQIEFARGRYAEAESISRQELAIREKTARSDDLRMAGNLNNLGAVRFILGHYDEGEAFYRRSLSLIEKSLGREHTETAGPATGSRSFIPPNESTGRRRTSLPV
jgi:tetratricopeptide (TPR) repeat protein